MEQSGKNQFLALYEPVHSELGRYCRAISGNKERAEDLMHDTLLVALEKFHQVKKPESFKYYLFGIAGNLHKMRIRKEKMKVELDEYEIHALMDEGLSSDQLTDFQLMYERLLQLPGRTAETLMLFYVSDLSLEEIRKVQGGNLSAVKQRLKRGREKLTEQSFSAAELRKLMLVLTM